MKKIPRRLLSFVLCICMLFALTPTVFAADKPEFAVSIEYEDGNSEGTFKVNDTVTAHIMVQRTDSEEDFDLYSLFLETTFDTNYLTPVSYKSDLASEIMIHSPLDISGSENYKQARITYHELGVAVPCSNKVEVATLTFTAKTETPDAGSIMSFFDGAKVEGKQGDVYTLQSGDYHRGIVHIGDTPATAYSVTYDLNGAEGTAPTESDHTAGNKFRLAAAPTREHYKFLGWNDGTNTLEANTEYIMPDHAVTFKAQWEQMDYKVHYEANEATSGTAPTDEWKTKGTNVNVQTSDLKKTGYTFQGWAYDGKTYAVGETFIMPEADVTFVAEWKQDSTGGGGGGGGGTVTTTYPVNITAPTNGSLTADKKAAEQGATVTITATPNQGYSLGKITVVDKNGKEIAVTAKDGVYTFTMPASAVTVSASFQQSGSKPSHDSCKKDESCPIYPFVDSNPKAWYHDGVHYCLDEGLMNGIGDKQFAPDLTTSRAMIVTILYRLEGKPATTTTGKYDDVPAGQWYSEAVSWADANGVVKGFGDGTFRPDDDITREQMATIFQRYAALKNKADGKKADLSGYTDAAEVSLWALEGMQWANGTGLIQGRTATTLAPGATATRAEAATILLRFCTGILK